MIPSETSTVKRILNHQIFYFTYRIIFMMHIFGGGHAGILPTRWSEVDIGYESKCVSDVEELDHL